MIDDHTPNQPPIDVDKIKEEAKAEVVKAAQEALISKIQGDKPRFSWEEKGKEAPENYNELFEEVERRVPKFTPEDIDKRVEEKLKQREELEKQRTEEEKKTREQELEEERKRFDQEWYDLVQQGKMPKVSDDIQKRIDEGEKLSKEEIMEDEGLVARLELAKLVASSNKSAKLAFYEDYSKEQPGTKAPVFGGRPSVSTKESEEPSYEEVAKSRKKIFGF